MHAIPDHKALVLIAAVPAEESFHQVTVRDDQSGRQHHLCHVVHVAHRDETLEAINFAQRNRQQQNHRKACIDRPGDKVGWKDRRVPPGNDADGEIETHNRVHRKYQRRRQSREQQISHLVAVPVPRRAAPAHRQHSVNNSEYFALGAIAQRRKVGD